VVEAAAAVEAVRAAAARKGQRCGVVAAAAAVRWVLQWSPQAALPH